MPFGSEKVEKVLSNQLGFHVIRLLAVVQSNGVFRAKICKRSASFSLKCEITSHLCSNGEALS